MKRTIALSYFAVPLDIMKINITKNKIHGKNYLDQDFNESFKNIKLKTVIHSKKKKKRVKINFSSAK